MDLHKDLYPIRNVRCGNDHHNETEKPPMRLATGNCSGEPTVIQQYEASHPSLNTLQGREKGP